MVAAAIIGSAVVGGVASNSASRRAGAAQDRASDSANRTAALAEEQYTDWRSTYKPLGDSLVRDAMQSGGLDEQARESERANGDVTQAFGRARTGLISNLASYGVDPSSSKYATSMTRLDLGEAAAGAGAQNAARTAVIDRSRAFKLDVNNSGRGIGSSSLAAMSGATGALGTIASMRAATASRDATGYGAIGGAAIRGLGDWWRSRGDGTDPASGTDPALLRSGFTANYNPDNHD